MTWIRVALLIIALAASFEGAALNCQEPAQSICSSPRAERARHIHNEIDQRYRRLRAKARIDESNYLGFCPTLAYQAGTVWASCHELVLRVLSRELSTPARVRIVHQEFANARRQVLAALDRKIAATVSPQGRDALLSRRKVVERAELQLDLALAAKAAGNLEPLSSGRTFSIWNAFTDISGGRIHLGAPLAIVEEFPLYVRWVLSHELAHLAGPLALTAIFGEFQGHSGIVVGFRPWSETHMPFLPELKCWMTQDKGFPRTRDNECMARELREAEERVVDLVRPYLEHTSKLFSESPIYSVPSKRDRLACQMDQTEEVFADAVASSSLPEDLSPEDLEATFAPTCVSTPALDDLLDDHPTDQERIALAFRLERVRKIARCQPNESPRSACEL